MTPSQVRAFVKTGLLGASHAHAPGRHYRFSFQDIVLLRMAQRLRATTAGPGAVVRGLRELKSRLPAGKTLSAVRVVAEDGKVLVREDDSLWHPESGQIQFDFSMSSLTREVEPMVKEKARSVQSAVTVSADEYYDLGIDLEMVGDTDAAEDAYRQAVSQEPGHADAWVNLGRLAFLDARATEAIEDFKRAIESEPGHATAWFNLGVVEEHQERPEAARACYEKAVESDPQFPDAHYNLARLFESLGDKRAALRHLNAYRKIVVS